MISRYELGHRHIQANDFILWVQVASRVLAVPCSKIHISETSTNTVPNTSPTAASASSDLNGAAVQKACEILVERLEPYKAKNPGGSWEDWVRSLHALTLSQRFTDGAGSTQLVSPCSR